MNRIIRLSGFFVFLMLSTTMGAQSRNQEILRGEIAVELEPVYLIDLGINSPLDTETASNWALEDTATAFSGMIYGWNFEYEPGERARQLGERLNLQPIGTVKADDARIKISDVSILDNVYYLWCDYHLAADQQNRLRAWNSAQTKGIKAMGHAPLTGPAGTSARTMIKAAALEDAIKQALRAELRSTERNRPRFVRGSIALAAFPLYRIFRGNWAAQASFRIRIDELVPYAVY
ncbi:MAG: hypothetical protein LBD22_04875 [Spirochaetaceae bacterium]|nr:hypothetical protein [Spirochaetaceae bacterium]